MPCPAATLRSPEGFSYNDESMADITLIKGLDQHPFLGRSNGLHLPQREKGLSLFQGGEGLFDRFLVLRIAPLHQGHVPRCVNAPSLQRRGEALGKGSTEGLRRCNTLEKQSLEGETCREPGGEVRGRSAEVERRTPSRASLIVPPIRSSPSKKAPPCQPGVSPARPISVT